MATTTAEARVRNARRAVTLATNQAAKVAADPSQARSTRTRTAYKIKAEALDKVGQILSGKK